MTEDIVFVVRKLCLLEQRLRAHVGLVLSLCFPERLFLNHTLRLPQNVHSLNSVLCHQLSRDQDNVGVPMAQVLRSICMTSRKGSALMITGLNQGVQGISTPELIDNFKATTSKLATSSKLDHFDLNEHQTGDRICNASLTLKLKRIHKVSPNVSTKVM